MHCKVRNIAECACVRSTSLLPQHHSPPHPCSPSKVSLTIGPNIQRDPQRRIRSGSRAAPSLAPPPVRPHSRQTPTLHSRPRSSTVCVQRLPIRMAQVFDNEHWIPIHVARVRVGSDATADSFPSRAAPGFSHCALLMRRVESTRQCHDRSSTTSPEPHPSQPACR